MSRYLTPVLSFAETIAFIVAAVLGVVADGKIDSNLGHLAIMAGALGAAFHGLIHAPPWDNVPPNPPV